MKKLKNIACSLWLVFGCAAPLVSPVLADDKAYFVTYDHHLEEPGSLELAYNPQVGFPPNGGNTFLGGLFEAGYGVKSWWTTEFYLGHQATQSQGGAFTGFHWENRFRPLQREYWINPVIYIEYAHKNEADRSFREITGHSELELLEEPISDLKKEWENELELKMILSSEYKGWNIAENFIAEKNLASHPWAFGYAWGVSRPLALLASPKSCSFCRENFRAGVEMYGGLGNRYDFGVGRTSQYLAPVLSWHFAKNASVRVSPSFGLNDGSIPLLLRFGIMVEFGGIGRR